MRGLHRAGVRSTAVLVLLLLGACHHGVAVQEKTVKLENGLTVIVPEDGYEIEQRPRGLRLRPSNWRDLRAPTEVTLEVRDSVPPGDFKMRRSSGSQEASYRIDTIAAGSGGEERTLRAWTSPSNGLYIYLQQITQSEEPKDSDFDLGWQILRSARMGR